MNSDRQQRPLVVDDAPMTVESQPGERATFLFGLPSKTGVAREPVMKFRLVPSDPELTPDQWAQLGTDCDLLVHVLGAEIKYIDAPCFHEPGTERALFGGRALLAENSTHFAGSPLAEHASERMGSSEEVLLFRQLNYCRMRQQRLQGLFRRKAVPLDKLRLLLAWTHRAMEIRDRIVESNMPLILAMVKKSRTFTLDFDELVSEGYLALLRCVDKFDYSRGFKFSTYVCGAILKSFVRVGIRTSRYRARFSVQFDPAMGPSVRPEQRSDEAQSACVEEIGRILAENRAALTAQERGIIDARFMFGTTSTGLQVQTLEQLGHAIGLTKERVRQIQNRALRKLRATLENSLIRSPVLSGGAQLSPAITACLPRGG